MNRRININKDLLIRLYIDQNLSPYRIGDMMNCSFKTVTNRLKDFKIPLKSPAFARMRYRKIDFSGSNDFRAYMIGFRIGDLNVYRVSKRSETIVVRCHTTQREQVDVVSALFSRFGRVDDTMKPSGHYYVNCFLNNSFEFLLPKGKNSWSWIEEPKTRFAFIAGYVDAEGNFILNQGRARFKLDSYDKDALDTIARWLHDAGISYKMRLIFKKGDKQKIYNKIGIYSNDLWRLNINQARDLKKFISLIRPFIRHGQRLRDIKLCDKNIIYRIKNGTI